eukprot:COSAG02_NODE_260_length_26771_cov_3110.350817_17_plen_96_part_00
MWLGRVWRRRHGSLVIDGGPAPFKTRGVVVGVAPQVLAVMLTDVAMKDHERHKAPHERNTEREMVWQPDPQTKVSVSLHGGRLGIRRSLAIVRLL